MYIIEDYYREAYHKQTIPLRVLFLYVLVSMIIGRGSVDRDIIEPVINTRFISYIPLDV